MKFKYLSLNIWFGGLLFDAAFDFLKKENPDILSLQEVYDSKDFSLDRNYQTIEFLKKELNMPYFHFAPSFLHLSPVGGIDIGNAVFSKFPIKNTQVTFYDKPYGEVDTNDVPARPFHPRNLQHVKIDGDGKVINIFNTHGVWGFDDRDNEGRLHMSKVIIEKIKTQKNVILSGDFNVDINTKSILNIEKYLKNVFRNKINTSFNTRVKTEPGFAKSIVDIMLISKNIKVIKASCPDIDVSDHLPLVAILQID